MMSDEHDPVDEDTFENPVFSQGGPAPDLGEGQPLPEPTDPVGTARMATSVVDWLVTMKWEAPLTEVESAELQADLAKVLAKHDVPNLPFHEELKLSMTVGGVVFRRAVAAKQKEQQQTAEQPKGQQQHGNHAGSRQEGKREVRFGPQDMFCRTSAEGGAVLP